MQAFLRCFAVIALLFGSPAGAEQLRLSLPQARGFGYQLLEQDRPQAAEVVAEGLLQADPDDVAALLLLARARIAMNRPDEALAPAQRAWSLSETASGRYAAAVTVARAHFGMEQNTRAQLWLRRAAENAPNDAARQRAERDFVKVRSRNRLSTHLSFGISPSSNVNNGTSAEKLTIYWNGLPFTSDVPDDDQALSGTSVRASVSTRYRLKSSSRYALDGLASLSHREVFLSREAKRKAPEAEGGDFRQTVLTFGPRLTLRSADGRSDLALDAAAGRLWYGGERLYDFTRLGATLRFAPAPRTALTASVERNHEAGTENRAERDSWQVALGARTLLDSGDALSLMLDHTSSTSEAAFLDYTRNGVEVSWAPSWKIAGSGLEFGLGYSVKDHERDFFSTDGRRETTSSARVTVVFDTLDYYGFVPSLTVSASRTQSDIDIYDSENVSVGMGVRSSF